MSARRAEDENVPQTPTGYRSTRRGSKALKQARKAERQHQMVTGAKRTVKTARNVGIIILQGIAGVVVVILVMLLAALAINGVARWNAKRVAADNTPAKVVEKRSKGNVLVIGADGEKAVGFLAMRVDEKTKQVFGIAIPDGAFLDVPGQGFVRIGDVYDPGSDEIVSSISNYLTVPFTRYVVVPTAVYQKALTTRSVAQFASAATASNMNDSDVQALGNSLRAVPKKNVAIVPLPTKPIKLGDQTYLEPQKNEVADLLKSWWGVDPNAAKAQIRVVVFNGSGKPGIAGEAAQELIRAQIRVVDTQNADRFDYAETKIVVRRGDASVGEKVRKALGVGKVVLDPSDENVTDVVVVVGKDYEPPKDSKNQQKGN
ncbi:MAG TPA: LytR C-terminal domain-containing protein [Coriobacteriia bacterium]|nr:LytR C-terminal domain-containing protein [Coriobacteriia bacterium]